MVTKLCSKVWTTVSLALLLAFRQRRLTLKSCPFPPIYEKVKAKGRKHRRFLPSGKHSLMSIRALIVDDSSVMRKIVERSLRQAGIDLSEVFQAGNGAEALGVLRDRKVDLIL